MTEHEHRWGSVERARFTGNPHRKCVVAGCNAVSLDLDDDDYDDDEINEAVLNGDPDNRADFGA